MKSFAKITLLSSLLSLFLFGDLAKAGGGLGHLAEIAAVLVTGPVGRLGSDAEGNFQRGLSFQNSNNHAEAVKYFRLAAEQEHADAQGELGTALLEGIGGKKDVEEGTKWIRLSATNGSATSQTMLGIYCYTGWHVPQDKPEGKRLLRLAIAQSDAQAKILLNRMEGAEKTFINGFKPGTPQWLETEQFIREQLGVPKGTPFIPPVAQKEPDAPATQPKQPQPSNVEQRSIDLPVRGDDASAVFSPDGKLIVTLADNKIQIWDAELGKGPIEFAPKHIRPIYSINFSPDGKKICHG